MNSTAIEKQTLQRTVEAIQNFLAIGGELTEDDIETLHSPLVELIEVANQRLETSDLLLRKGLRSEAIQEAELEPNLFDVVAELDFPEWNDWRAYVVANGFSPQPDLLLDIAAALNEAYTANQPLEKLLRRHRVYALARGDLAERVKILRAIAKVDSDNPIWQQDLKAYEKARCTQIEREFQASVKRGSFSEIKRLHQEISGPTWSSAPNQSLAKKIEREYRNMISTNAMGRLVELEQSINRAYSAFDVENALSLIHI